MLCCSITGHTKCFCGRTTPLCEVKCIGIYTCKLSYRHYNIVDCSDTDCTVRITICTDKIARRDIFPTHTWYFHTRYIFLNSNINIIQLSWTCVAIMVTIVAITIKYSQPVMLCTRGGSCCKCTRVNITKDEVGCMDGILPKTIETLIKAHNKQATQSYNHSTLPFFRDGVIYRDSVIRESVDSLCRDDADMPMPPYIRKAYNRPNAAFVSLFR